MEAIPQDTEKYCQMDTPIMLLINDESGICYYFYRFRNDIDINPQLISGALIAITQLMEVALNFESNSLTQLQIDSIEVEMIRFDKLYICCFYHSSNGIGPLFDLSSVLCATKVWQKIQEEGIITEDDTIEINAILSELYAVEYII